ncbi:MAG TPA: RdgB/HAM1 family non-canonical purine NTP pyrophosphatase [Woeseiaceae bacterium]|nr:RdgB/HAM1 family non-canonical purine NTP pyrophosphatase [Woeseiaceae bacterium]
MKRRGLPVVAATGNPGKLKEIQRLLAGLGLALSPQSDFGIGSPEETGASFLENALIKARHASAVAGYPAIADDSGLAVAFLQGRPGIHSARYAGPRASDRQNIRKLLRELEGLSDDERSASFHCVAVFVASPDDAAPLVAEGVWPGRILESPRGRAGFGYDPVFYDPASAKAAAEMSEAEKNEASHRGRAFRRLAELLAARGVVPQ